MKKRERFWSKVNKTESCWEWKASLMTSGYGQFRLGDRMILAHRCAYELEVGPIPEGMCVLHRCDNRVCVNPDHLWLGTKGDNNADRDAKNRQIRGEAHHSAKLTRADVTDIRASRGKATTTQLAARYDVSPGLISMIHLNQIWRTP